MAFIKKTWLARLGTGLNKFTVNNSASKISLDSAPDSITQEGTPLSAQNMNDLEGRIETAFTGVDTDLTHLAGNFAQIETTPSTHNYSVGDMLVFNGILYKVTTAIATNDALVVGSNIEAQTVANAISDIITLLWTNPTPSSSFTAQTIPLDLSQYQFILILTYGIGSVYKSVIGLVGTTVGVLDNDNTLRYREFTINSTGIDVETGCYATSYNGSVRDGYDDVAKPYKIYGIKMPTNS